MTDFGPSLSCRQRTALPGVIALRALLGADLFGSGTLLEFLAWNSSFALKSP